MDYQRTSLRIPEGRVQDIMSSVGMLSKAYEVHIVAGVLTMSSQMSDNVKATITRYRPKREAVGMAASGCYPGVLHGRLAGMSEIGSRAGFWKLGGEASSI